MFRVLRLLGRYSSPGRFAEIYYVRLEERSRGLYVVTDEEGRVLGVTTSYGDALRIAREYVG